MRNDRYILGTSKQAVNSLIHLLFLFHQIGDLLQSEDSGFDPPFFEFILKRLFQKPPEGGFDLVIPSFFLRPNPFTAGLLHAGVIQVQERVVGGVIDGLQGGYSCRPW
jgi:hypothetical protein